MCAAFSLARSRGAKSRKVRAPCVQLREAYRVGVVKGAVGDLFCRPGFERERGLCTRVCALLMGLGFDF